MANSPTHLFGQIIGDIVEEAFFDVLIKFCREHHLYLDKKGDRPARKGKKISWEDKYGSRHDLDYVIERNGTDTEIGQPIAFIESAWRSYTKHSKNKVQEIEGALNPLFETFEELHPFKGAILSGEFTQPSIDQLVGQGFNVLYIPRQAILDSFEVVGIDANWGEDTPDIEVAEKINAWNRLTQTQKDRVKRAIISNSREQTESFIRNLEVSITRQIDFIVIIPLYGQKYTMPTIKEALNFLDNFKEVDSYDFQKFEVEIRYNNGDTIRGTFSQIEGVKEFLSKYNP